MTARPDEVVAEMSIEDAIAVFDKSATRTIPNAQTRAWSLLRGAFAEYQAAAGMLAIERAEFRIRAEKAEAALQSANARLAEMEAERDAALAKAAEWNRIAESTREWGRQHLKNYDALTAAVLALADTWFEQNDKHRQECGSDGHALKFAAELRRAAAGEGDANQGDGE